MKKDVEAAERRCVISIARSDISRTPSQRPMEIDAGLTRLTRGFKGKSDMVSHWKT